MKSRTEVFFVIGSLHIGGAENHLSMVSQMLAKRGHAVTVYNLSGNNDLGDAMVNAGVNLIGPPLNSRTGKLRFLNPVFLGLSSLKLFLIFLFRRPKIVHFFLPHAYIIGAIMARCAGLQYLIMSRRSLNIYQDHLPFIAWIEQKLHGSMSAIAGNSRAVVTQLHQEEGVAEDKLRLIYNGIAIERFDVSLDTKRLRKQLGISSGAIVMAIVANLISYKGHADLLQALSNIRSELPGDWTLLVIGRDDGIAGKLKKQASDSGLDQNIQFLGLRDDIPELLCLSDLAVLSSHQEGFSNTILEGMAAGLPMVVTNVGGNAEAVVDGETGLVVPAHAPSELGAAILSLIKDAQLRKRMGRAGKRRVEEQFSLETCVSKYEVMYGTVTSD